MERLERERTDLGCSEAGAAAEAIERRALGPS